MQLVIGNKNYSSWSMRPWVLMKHFGLPFEERLLKFDTRKRHGFQAEALKVSPAARVPVWVDDDGFAVWDSLAIAEALAERFPALPLWPRDAKQRARARSLCAEMHAGFAALRTHCPMNIEAALPAIGPRVLAEQPEVRANLERIDAMWRTELAAQGGPFLFGAFGIVDAYFAPVVSRIRTYGLPLSAPSAAYAEAVWASPGVQAWVAEALAEHDFIDEGEPYRPAPA